MSANVNVTNPARRKKVLMVVANPATSPTTGWPVGFWWAELTHPYWAFTEAGYEIEIRSPRGGKLQADGYSDPEDPSGYSAHDILSLGFKKSPRHAALLQDTPSIAGVKVADYDAVFVAGGQSPMVTFRGDAALQALVAGFYEAGKVTALVCHATCLLLETRLSDGQLLVEGKTWTGFANSEEQFADGFVGRRIQPFWIEEEARRLPGTNFVVDQRFREFAVRDGLLVTGQQQFGAAAARLVIEALGAVTAMRIAFIGCGQVGAPLADHLQRLGHEVALAAADPGSGSVRRALARNAGLKAAPPREAVEAAEVVFLCTPFQANEAALQGLAGALQGKVLVDCTNPVGPGLSHGLGGVQSGSQRVQQLAPGARVVKAFSVYGYENFEDNRYPGGPLPAMFFCGADADAKRVVGGLIAQLGWEPLDVGGLEQALHLEHMTLLWVRLVRAGGASPHLVWAALRR